jgi:hypothetical protein
MGGVVRVYSLNMWVIAALVALVPSQGEPRKWTAPETFFAKAESRSGEAAVASAPLTIQVDRYTKDADRTAMETALKTGGYPAFLTALRKAPEVGYVEAGNKKFTIRWARQIPDAKGRTISIVTDAPIYFVGGGRPDAKPKEGYELAVLQLIMDSSGVGEGSMAAAARVKPGGPTGVRIDQYADQPIKLISITRQIK